MGKKPKVKEVTLKINPNDCRRQYQRAYYRRNAERLKKRQRAYRAANLEACRKREKEYAAANRARKTANYCLWVKRNRARWQAYQREYRKKDRLANPLKYQRRKFRDMYGPLAEPLRLLSRLRKAAPQ